jgi:tripartite ATP-independent transporter DctP family solute receptor
MLALVFVGGSAASGAQFDLQAGITLTLDSHYAKGLEEFGRLVKEYSNGTVTLTVHPNSLLGGERDLIESVAMGTVAMALISTGPVPNFFPDFAVLDLPYLFPSAEIAYKALDGEVGTELLGQMTSKGILALGFWENGIRHVTNSVREIKTPEDLKGLKIRTMENDIHMNTYRHYGASPTPMAMGEVFLALQQGVVDGQENPAINILTSRLNEVQKFMSLTGNFYSPSVLMLSKTIFDSMSKAQQDAVLKAADEAKHWQRKYSQDNTAKAIADISASGTLVTEVDVNVWLQGSQNTYKDYEGKVRQDMIQKIRELK